MAEQEYRVLLNVDTGEGVKSIGDLKNNIKFLKKALDSAEIGTQEYQNTLKELNLNQKALKTAMNATSRSMKEVSDVANGAGESYDALSHKMAMLKNEMKQTSDEAKRNELSAHIDEINDKLKEMDARNGVFSRNVGDYEHKVASAFSRISGGVQGVTDSFSGMGIAVGGLQTPLMALNGMFKVLSANPFIAVLGAIVIVLQKVAGWIKTSEDNVNALNMALAPLTASATAFKNIMQKLGEWLAKGAQWLTNLAKKLHLFSDEMLESIEIEEDLTNREAEYAKRRREVEKQNADDMLEIAKLKSKSAEKDKYTAQERIKFIDEAIKLEEGLARRRKELAEEDLRIQEGRSAQAGNSAEENDKLAEAYVNVKNAEADYFNKKKELSAQRVEAINMIKAEQKALQGLKETETEEAVAEPEEEVVEEVDVEAENEALKQQYITDAQWQGMSDRLDVQQAERDALAEHYAEEERMAQEAMEAQEQIRRDGLMSLAGITSDILGSIAGAMDTENEKQFRISKGLQIAQATINTIAGAVATFSGITSSTGGWGIALAVAKATAVLTAGMAQVAKIKQTKFNRSGSTATPSAGGIGASVEAPQVEQAPTMVRNVTGAKEEDRLNEARKPQKVYILQSDLEASRESARAQVAETSF